jgi:lactose/L-arabinose transport system permease protein
MSQRGTTMGNKKKMGLLAKQRAAGWAFLFLASAMIVVMSFYPMVQALITSFKTGSSANLQWAEPLTYNYKRMFQDKMFMKSVGNTFLYLIIQVPIILFLQYFSLSFLITKILSSRDFSAHVYSFLVQYHWFLMHLSLDLSLQHRVL